MGEKGEKDGKLHNPLQKPGVKGVIATRREGQINSSAAGVRGVGRAVQEQNLTRVRMLGGEKVDPSQLY